MKLKTENPDSMDLPTNNDSLVSRQKTAHRNKHGAPTTPNGSSGPIYPGIFVKDGYLFEENLKEGARPIGRAIHLDQILLNQETGIVTFVVSYEYQGQPMTFELPRSDLTRGKIIQLAEVGGDVFEHNATTVVKHLLNEEKNLPVTEIHSTVGWGEADGQLFYKAALAVNRNSEYRGPLSIAPKGSFEGWQRLVKEHVLGHIPLESILIFALSAVVVGLIAKDTSQDTLIIHIYAESSTGKSTATKLGISAFGYPDLKEDGLYGTWHATKNAAVSALLGNNGMAAALDELSLIDLNDLSSLVYSIASGKDKRRMDKEGKIRDTANWNTTIISNGEHSLSTKTSQNTGLKVRKFEFGNVVWTENAEHADAIRMGVLEHYGHAAPLMAKKMIELGKPAVLERWKDASQHIQSLMPNTDPFSERIAARIAIIAVTTEIAQEALGLEFHLDEILKFILEHEQQAMVDRDIFLNAYNYFLEQVTRNKHKFSVDFGTPLEDVEPKNYTYNESWGKIEFKDTSKIVNEERILILTGVFRDLMKAGGFQDPQIILKEWKKRGILDCESDRFTRSRKIVRDSVQVYVIRVQQTKEDAK